MNYEVRHQRGSSNVGSLANEKVLHPRPVNLLAEIVLTEKELCDMLGYLAAPKHAPSIVLILFASLDLLRRRNLRHVQVVFCQ